MGRSRGRRGPGPAGGRATRPTWVRAAILSSATRHAGADPGRPSSPPSRTRPRGRRWSSRLIATLAASGRRPSGRSTPRRGDRPARGRRRRSPPGGSRRWPSSLDSPTTPRAAETGRGSGPAFDAARLLAGDPGRGPGRSRGRPSGCSAATSRRDADRRAAAELLDPQEPARGPVGRGPGPGPARRPAVGRRAPRGLAGPGPALRVAGARRPAGAAGLGRAPCSTRSSGARSPPPRSTRRTASGSSTTGCRRSAPRRPRSSAARHRARGRRRWSTPIAPASVPAGRPERGQDVFERLCAACHKLDGQGHEVGPDLAALTDTSPEALLVAILDPNREVDARYANYTAALKDGRVAHRADRLRDRPARSP